MEPKVSSVSRIDTFNNTKSSSNNNSSGTNDSVSSSPDIWRDTPIRLLGYANEVGESFRSMVHVNVVRASYAVAFGYCLCDTVDKTTKMSKKGSPTCVVALTAVDTLIWQTLASVAIPGYTINRTCALSLFLLQKTKLATPIQKLTTTAIGLGTIPFIYKPIDEFTDWLMGQTFRRAFPIPRT